MQKRRTRFQIGFVSLDYISMIYSENAHTLDTIKICFTKIKIVFSCFCVILYLCLCSCVYEVVFVYLCSCVFVFLSSCVCLFVFV